EFENFFRQTAFANDFLGLDILEARQRQLPPEKTEKRFGLRRFLFQLNLAHTSPILKFARLDHIKHDDRSGRTQHAARRVIERAFDFLALVDDDQELAAVAFFE